MIAHYEIVATIGAGGMGVVYLARDQHLERNVALKFLPSALCRDTDFRTRFTREARAAAGLSHPNVVTVHEVGEHEGRPYIVMEHVDGRTLAELVSEGPLPVDRAIEIARQLCDGLGKAHEHGIVHRDIKSSNIIVDADGRARILDFGVAVLPGSERVTMTGSKVGTLAYMSPEQAEGRPVDQRTDLFSLGAVLYEMLTGQTPFERDSIAATVQAICRETHEPARRRNSAVPEAMERVLDRLLQKDLDDRYGSAAEVASDLAAVAAGVAPTQAASATRRRGPRVAMFAVSALVVLGALALYAAWLAKPAERETPRLVVIPFENLGPPQYDAVAAAISEEINSFLGDIEGIFVISRTSARTYLTTPTTVRKIGDELGVNHVLEGTVTVNLGADGSVGIQVKPRLIRVRDEFTIWKERYNEEIDDIFEVQARIARQVVRALNVTLLGSVASADEIPPTQNLEAHYAFVRAKDYTDQPDPGVEHERRKAVQMFQHAVHLDSEFAEAWAELSWAHSDMYRWGHDRTDERLELARFAAARALEIRPGLPEGHMALGYHLQTRREFDQALEEFTIAEQSLPRNVRIMLAVATIWSIQGRYDDAAARLDSAHEYSPRDAFLHHEIGEVYLPPRKFAEAERFYARSIALAPDQVLAYACQAENYWMQGMLGKALEMVDRMSVHNDKRGTALRFRASLYSGDYEKALEFAKAAPFDVLEGPVCYQVRSLYEGSAYELLEQPEQARASYEEALVILEEAALNRPEDDRIRATLAHCYAGLGRKEDAIREAQRAVDMVPYSVDSHMGAARRADLAAVYTTVGDLDRAVDEIEFLLSVPSYITPHIIHADPAWRDLRNHPRLLEVLAEYEDAEPTST
jgi:TolB-like protein/Tfp pilus assembly protein PilF/predicted Ser/Thr protein kinase